MSGYAQKPKTIILNSKTVDTQTPHILLVRYIVHKFRYNLVKYYRRIKYKNSEDAFNHDK